MDRKIYFYQRLAARSLYGYFGPNPGGGAGRAAVVVDIATARCGISNCPFITACRRTLTSGRRRRRCGGATVGRAFVNWYLMGILN